MKNYLILCVIILLSKTLTAQKYNIYEVSKGEILKRDYESLTYLVNNLYAASIKNDGAGNSKLEYLTGIIDGSETTIFPFQYGNIRNLWANFNKPNNAYIEISNSKGFGLFEIKDKTNIEQIIDFNYWKFRHFIFNKTCITAYARVFDIFNLTTGKITKTNFDEIEPLTDNLIATKEYMHKWGISDINGNVIYRDKFDRLLHADDSLIIASSNDSSGVINHKGELILPLVFKHIKVNNGRIFAQLYNNGIPIKLNETVKNKISDYTITLNKVKYYSVDLNNNESEGLCGAFDKSGNPVIPFEYEILESGINGNLIAAKNNKFGILSHDGEILVNHKYDNITIYFDKFYVLQINNKWGVLNGNFKEVLPNIYDEVLPISDNEFLVLDKTNWYKYSIDENYIIKKQKLNFGASYDFSHYKSYSQKSQQWAINQDYFLVMKNGKCGVVSKYMVEVIPPLYDFVLSDFNSIFFEFEKNGKSIYFNTRGKEIKDVTIESYGNYGKYSKTIICTKNGKYGLIHSDGNTLIPFIYEQIIEVNEKQFIVKK